MPGGRRNKRVTSSGSSSVEQQGDITKTNLEKEQTTPTEKDESIESTAANDDSILEQQQDVTDHDVISEEDSISKETSSEKNERKTVFIDQDEDLIELDSDAESLDEDIEQVNKINVNNTQVGQNSGFNDLSFSGHNEFGATETEVVNTDDAHVELSNDDKSKSLKQTSETYNEAEIGQISAVQSPTSQYTTPPEVSESSDTKTINNDGLTSLDDGTDDEVSELEDILEPKGEERTLEEGDELIQSRINEDKVEDVSLKLQNTDDQNSSIDYTSEPELKDDSKLAEEETVLGEKNEHETTDINFEPRKVSLSDSESLAGLDSSTPDTQTSRMSEDSSILSDHNSPKKKVSKSPFANFSKGEKALLFFVALSSTAFIASFISSVLGKPLCPDEKGNLISLAILGTVAIVSVTVSLAHFYCSNKSKENDPLSEFDSSEVEMLTLESKKNK